MEDLAHDISESLNDTLMVLAMHIIPTVVHKNVYENSHTLK